jgi:hypothetical protein
MTKTRTTWIAATLSAVFATGCECGSPSGAPPGSLDGSGVDGSVPGLDSGPPAPWQIDGSRADLFDGSRADWCAGQGPPVTVTTGTQTGGTVTTCTGAIASRVFANAVCSCTDINSQGYVVTRSFSSNIPGSMYASAAAVGVNEHYNVAGYTDVGGTFAASNPGETGLAMAGYVRIGGDLSVGGATTAAGYINVARDAWFEGSVTLPGLLSVGRDVHLTPRASLLTVPVIGGQTVQADFDVPDPCACGEDEILDVGAIVETGRTINDNASINLDPDAFQNIVGIGVEKTLPCGRFYITGISGVGGVTLHVPGRTALFIDGDVAQTGALNVDLGPDGELDVFIDGNLISTGAASFGSQERPAASRIYLSGAGDVVLTGATGFVGNLYAPRSRITSTGAAFVYGSIFGRVIDIPGFMSVMYDVAIADAGDDCPPPVVDDPSAPPCQVCGDQCGSTQACVSGTCGPCASDADCCAPLVCDHGECVPLILQ